MLVVADTSPLNYLILLDQTALLPALYTQVVLPPVVVAELGDLEAPEAVRTWVTSLPGWCEVRRPRRIDASTGLEALEAGEKEAIVLAQELGADLLLIDEEDGR